MSTKNPGPVLFTQFDTVVGFNPNPGTLGVRVGQVSGAINGTIVLNTTFAQTAPPPFKSTGNALVIDTDGDQILFDVVFTGKFLLPPFPSPGAPLLPPPPALPVVAAAGAYTAAYTVSQATGKYSGLVGKSFNGVGCATQPAQNASLGAAFTQIFGTLNTQKATKKAAKPK
jgi:hypothetical protein